ncbi:MAG: NAD(P)/FAD-dependent oxidoreductase [Reyranella sp.]|nr:NAD(P)/FAD-dependent oxidoreductase [Reyranella sp.]
MSSRDLAELEARVRRDLALISYPELRWLSPVRGPDGEKVLDVLIVGGGQGGQALSFKLKLERIDNHLVIDRGPAGAEGPWRTFGRMKTLRTWKTVTGPDLGIPSLTYQSWFEAQHGAEAFVCLNKIARESWSDYLHWLRRVLALPVEVGTELLGLEPHGALLRVRVKDAAGEREILARHVVLAHGIEASGRWTMPAFVERLPAGVRAHAADAIDFAALAGRRVAVLGAGASAFDNAATALEAGAEVHLFCRRPELQRVQPYKWLSFPAFFRHLGDLDDATRWKFMNYVLSLREALPVETWDRVSSHAAFHLHTGAPWLDARSDGAGAIVVTPGGEHRFDFVICGTGFDVDLGLRPELAAVAPHVRAWRDAYAPPAGQDNARLERYPYLGPGFELLERAPGTASWLGRIRLFNFGSTLSFGPSGSSINGMKFAVPRLVEGLTRDLFRAEVDRLWQGLTAYDTPEFPTRFARDR